VENGNKCCFTGYRPSKFPFLLNKSSKEYIDFENRLVETILNLVNCSVNEFYCGLAMGFDIIAGECVLLAREIHPDLDIKLVCAVPFKGQADNFPPEWKKRYNNLIDNADSIILTSGDYHRGCFAIRNKFMVDASDTVVTWYDGKPGGTKSTLNYAASKGRKIINLHDDDIVDNKAFLATYFEIDYDTEYFEEEE